MAKRKQKPADSVPAMDPLQWARDHLSPQEFKALTASLDKELPISIRINQLKAYPQRSVEEWGRRYRWAFSPIPYCGSGYWIENPSVPPSRTIEHRLGYFYIQEAASMLPAELFDFDGIEHPLILDMAASPGGKTIHLADRTMDSGLIIANDASRSRIPALRIVLQNWGVINQAVTQLQGEWYGQSHANTFDAVLLDAPCSMQGLHTSASHGMRPITENEILTLADRQYRLLKSALRAAKIGGQVVYSTCTLSPNENEGVVSRILETCPDAIEIVDINHLLPTPAPAMTNFEGNHFHQQVMHAARLWPHTFGTAGFFCAKFRKKGAISAEKNIPAQSKRVSAKGVFLTEKEAQALTDMISDLYGFDLREVIERQSLTYWQYKEDIYLVPTLLQNHFPNLPIHSMGMLAGKYFPNGWQPSHEFVSRFGDQFTENCFMLDNVYHEAWFRGEDIRGIKSAERLVGKVLLIRDEAGRNLGRGKMLSKRLRNMLPTRLF